MALEEERRKSFRVPFTAHVNCTIDEIGNEVSGILRDVSMSGIYMETKDRPPLDAPCSVEIVLQGNNSRLVIDQLQGRVVRMDDEGVAVNFDSRMEWFALIPIYSPKMKKNRLAFVEQETA